MESFSTTKLSTASQNTPPILVTLSLKFISTATAQIPSRSDTMDTTDVFPSATGLLNVESKICTAGMRAGKIKTMLKTVGLLTVKDKLTFQ